MPAGLAATSVAARMEWPLNWRVKLNSPSLWPTMFSVIYTGINFLPLCTAIVWPTISGMMVERRDQVRSTFFSLREFMPSTRVCRKPSTNGPFFVERAIKSVLFLAAPVDDKCVRALVIPRLVSASRLSPRGHRVAATGSFAFATAVRVIHRIHRDATIVRPLPQPPRTSGFADGDVFVIEIAHLANRRHATLRNFANLARRQFHQRILAFLGHQLSCAARRTHHLRALARLQFDIVNRRARRNVVQRQRIADENIGIGTAQHFLPDLESVGLRDVTLLAIGVAQ